MDMSEVIDALLRSDEPSVAIDDLLDDDPASDPAGFLGGPGAVEERWPRMDELRTAISDMKAMEQAVGSIRLSGHQTPPPGGTYADAAYNAWEASRRRAEQLLTEYAEATRVGVNQAPEPGQTA